MHIKKTNFQFFYLLIFIIFTFCQSKSETEILRQNNKGITLEQQPIRTATSDSKQEEENVGERSVRSPSTRKIPYLVYKVIDGDTFWMKDQNQMETKVRLIGIDTPETRNTKKKKKGYFGEEAKVYLKSLILDQYVYIEQDVQSRDQYGRLLAYVYTENNLFINADLIANGYAVLMTVPPNIKFENEFYMLQQKARQNKLGMWK